MSKGSFYYYFDDKADLFTTVADLAWAIVLPVEQLDLETFSACIAGREVQRSPPVAG
jgi:AcrR family transcriptional regulator